MPDPLYAHEKLGSAVQTLATGRGRIKERLNDAVGDLALVDDEVFDLPGIYREAPEFWRRIWGAITSAKLKVGSAPASIEKMTEEEAARVAQDIVSLDAMLDDYIEDQKAGGKP